MEITQLEQNAFIVAGTLAFTLSLLFFLIYWIVSYNSGRCPACKKTKASLFVSGCTRGLTAKEYHCNECGYVWHE